MNRTRERFIKLTGFLFSIIAVLILMIYILVPPLQIVFLILYWKNKKDRLNNHYCFSYNKRDDRHYLHHSPILIINFTSSTKFYKYREEAVKKFKREHPDVELYAKTMTLQSYYEKKGYVGTENKMTIKIVFSTFLAIYTNTRNISNYKVFRLVKRVFSEEVMLYKIQ